MPHYKLTFFNGRYRGEVARYLFALGSVPYEDVRIDREQWAKIKPGTTFGKIPMLEVDGVEHCQSGAINRFLAREFGFYGNTSAETFRVDMITDCVADVHVDLFSYGFALQGEAKEKAKQKLVNDTLPKLVAFVDKELGTKQWLVGNKVSLADVTVMEIFDFVIPSFLPVDQWAHQNEKIQALVDRVKALPEIAAYIAKRPTA